MYFLLKVEHGYRMEPQRRRFDSLEQFGEWKKRTEQLSRVSFVRFYSSAASEENASDFYYVCSRQYLPGKSEDSSRLCSLTSQASHCPAFMRVSKCEENGSLEADYCLQHVGHSTEILHTVFVFKMILLKLSILRFF